MSKIPKKIEFFDNRPKYAKLYLVIDGLSAAAHPADYWPQRASEQPFDVQREQVGKKAANLSLLCGFLAPLAFFLGFWLLVQDYEVSGLQVALAAPVLNVLGIWQGRVAQRHGTRALEGRILNGLGLCFFIGIAALFMYIANALSQIN